MAAFFARAFEPALAAIGSNIAKSATEALDGVGSAAVGLSVGAGSVDPGFFNSSAIFGTGVSVGGASGGQDS